MLSKILLVGLAISLIGSGNNNEEKETVSTKAESYASESTNIVEKDAKLNLQKRRLNRHPIRKIAS